ncbi:hypothetical protein Btru_028854 [Bulinus truncatus]|nr:hypothetical protein Btru_028854 [Bulinus truncatus]
MIPVSQPVMYTQPVIYPQTVSYHPLPAYSRNDTQTAGNVFNSILWFLALIFFAWPLALMVCTLYVLISPFGPCCSCMAII